MKKKIAAIFLALLMLGSLAQAEGDWAEGLSPQKPYSGSKEVDFNESIGFILLMPFNGSYANPGELKLTIALPRTDIALDGEGVISVYGKTEGLLEEIKLDSDKVTFREMTEEEKEYLIWGCGTVIEIQTDVLMEANRVYYVNMTEGCIFSEAYGTKSDAVNNDYEWTFTTEVHNYVEEITYMRTVEGQERPKIVKDVQVGDEAKVSVVINDPGVSAAVFCDAGSIIPGQTFFGETGETTIKFPSNGDVTWGIKFFNEYGKVIYSMDYTTTVSAQ